ncbi:MAG: MetQ/NlpA family ABC transporter substrate-binding protein [Treponema sp.]|jgi:D-methionine transport system substrate-binding protein|nr:MetQ/NlpA family ABC transporter substrate-binding protein [Treponema sp.]
MYTKNHKEPKFPLLAAALFLIAASVFAGGKKAADNELKVGASPVPHAELLELIVEDLAKQGITLRIIVFNDYVQPNQAVEDGELAANYFQTIPYLEEFNKDRGFHLVNVGGIHIEPMALYSKKYKDLASIPQGATIAIPNDGSNENRALLLLQAGGLIKLQDTKGRGAVLSDIIENPRSINFYEMDPPNLPRTLSDVDAAVINGNYAIDAGLSARNDGLVVEGSSSPYVNVVAVRAGSESRPEIIALVKALQSEKIKNYINNKWTKGEVLPVF